MDVNLKPGDIFEQKYRIEATIGEGSFARVYLAEHIDLGHRVAIKVLHKADAEARFVREGQILARLKSPYTVRVLDFGRTADGAAIYLVSEFVDGETLASVIRQGPKSWAEAWPIVEQILLSLKEAHEAGVVHRDLKPANIMQLRDGTIRTLDFGVAKLQMEDLTKSGAIIGTVRYMAPENLTGSRHATPAVDVYAVGLLAQALLTGMRPFEGASTHQIVQELMSPGPLTLARGLDLPAPVRQWIERLLDKDLARRPPDAGAALEALEHAMAGRPMPDQMEPDLQTIGHQPLAQQALEDQQSGPQRVPQPVPSPPVEHSTLDYEPRPAPAQQEPEEGSAGPATLTGLVLLGVFVVVFGGGFLWLQSNRSDRAESPVPQRPVDAPVEQKVSAEFESGVARFELGDWLGALEEFSLVEAGPTAEEARLLDEHNYVRRAIDELVEQPPSKDTKRHLEAALKLYPDDAVAKARLAEVTSELNRPKKKPNRYKGRGYAPPPARSFNDLLR